MNPVVVGTVVGCLALLYAMEVCYDEWHLVGAAGFAALLGVTVAMVVGR